MNLEQLEQYKSDLKISIDKIIREEAEMILKIKDKQCLLC